MIYIKLRTALAETGLTAAPTVKFNIARPVPRILL